MGILLPMSQIFTGLLLLIRQLYRSSQTQVFGRFFWRGGYVLLLASVLVGPFASAGSNMCNEIFKGFAPTDAHFWFPDSLRNAWEQSASALQQIKRQSAARDPVVKSLATALLAKQRISISGKTGSAESLLSRLMFESVLNAIPETEKKLFAVRFHEFIERGEMPGFAKFSAEMSRWRAEMDVGSPSAIDHFLFLLTVYARTLEPPVAAELYATLEQFKTDLGENVVEALLSSGVLTSSTTAGTINPRSFASGKIVLTPTAIEIYASRSLSTDELMRSEDFIIDYGQSQLSLHLPQLVDLTGKVILPFDMLVEIAAKARALVDSLDAPSRAAGDGRMVENSTANESAANSLNNLRMQMAERLVEIVKAEFIAHQLLMGVPFAQIRFIPDRQEVELFDIFTPAPASEKAAEELRPRQKPRLTSPSEGIKLAVFHRVNPGTFKMGKGAVEVTLTQPFEMMATLTTQLMWRRLADLAQEKFGDKYNLDRDPSLFVGDAHPVEMISYENVQRWIAALNELSRAAEPGLLEIIADHRPGDIYRLPTEAEWEYVLRGGGQYTQQYHFGDGANRLVDYAWFVDNSGGKTHPVAQKFPLVFGGKFFYDMLGNVAEWVQDWYSEHLPGGVDPQGPPSGRFRVKRGGSAFSWAPALQSAARNFEVPTAYLNLLGFRLVRVLNEAPSLGGVTEPEIKPPPEPAVDKPVAQPGAPPRLSWATRLKKFFGSGM